MADSAWKGPELVSVDREIPKNPRTAMEKELKEGGDRKKKSMTRKLTAKKTGRKNIVSYTKNGGKKKRRDTRPVGRLKTAAFDARDRKSLDLRFNAKKGEKNKGLDGLY